MKRRLAIVLLATLASSLWAPGEGAALDLDVGARVGGNWNILARPTDPIGEPTILFGSAFSGFGFSLGPSAALDVYHIEGAARLIVSADLLYSYHAGSGYAEHAASAQKRTVTIATHTVRVPLLLHLAGEERKTGMRIGAGVDLIAGLSSQSTVVEEGIPGQPQPLDTMPKTHITGTMLLAFDYHQPSYFIPLEARFTWNPSVPRSTRERFDGYKSFDEPGRYQVAFNWQIMLMTGFSWGL
ncbi:MAG: hypothetical protein H0U74_08860 [Bradymonadaceae bacterium]|nr:hypothetical protein [Lujinxingiaceae bacterium]